MKSKNNTKIMNIKKVMRYLVTSFALSLFLMDIAFASPVTSENIINLINKERTADGLNQLQINYELNRAAQMKSKDMLRRNYFEHYAYGITPWDFIRNAGYDYLYAGENLAMNFNTSEGMFRAWMDSPTHRNNILDSDFSDTGIGVIKGTYTENGIRHETIMVTNMFGKKKTLLINIVEKIKNVFILY